MKHVNIKLIKKFWDKLGNQERANSDIYNDCPRSVFVRRLVKKMNFANYYRFMIGEKMHVGTRPLNIYFALTRTDKIIVRYFSVIENDVVELLLSHNDTLNMSYQEISKEQYIGIENICIGTLAERFNNHYGCTHQHFSDYLDSISSHVVTRTIYERLMEDITNDKLQGIADLIQSTGIFNQDGTVNTAITTQTKGKKKRQIIYHPQNMPTSHAWFYLVDTRRTLVKFGFIKETEKQFLKRVG